MKTQDILRLAAEALSIRRDIMSASAQYRRDLMEKESESRANTARHFQTIAESAAHIRNLKPVSAVDPVQVIEQNEQATLAKLRARASVQAEQQRQSRSNAEQAALNRAAFVEKVRREVPTELQEETLDNFDRNIFENQEGET